MAIQVIPQHGTRARYYHRDPTIRCRLECCRAAQARYQRDYRIHGAQRWTTRPDGFRQMRIPMPPNAG